MIHLKSPGEIEVIGRAGAIAAEALVLVRREAAPGVSTAELDALAEELVRERGGLPAFKGLYGFPATLCTSLNREVVHGIPAPERRLAEGDLLSVDVGVELDRHFADAAVTLPIGRVSPEAERLVDVTRRALYAGIEQARVGERLGDLGRAIQALVEEAGFSVVRELVGHGVGFEPHEEPQVPNYGTAGQGLRLREGLVIAIEPMVNAGGAQIRTLDDGWTVVTADGGLSAHFEHTVAVTGEGPRILTALPVEAGARTEP